MLTRNNCYTYFKIVGDFNPDDVSKLLLLHQLYLAKKAKAE